MGRFEDNYIISKIKKNNNVKKQSQVLLCARGHFSLKALPNEMLSGTW